MFWHTFIQFPLIIFTFCFAENIQISSFPPSTPTLFSSLNQY